MSHETRLERAIRQAVAEEIATRLDGVSSSYSAKSDERHALAVEAGKESHDGQIHRSAAQAFGKKADAVAEAARIAREIGSKEHSNQATEETK